MTTENSVIIILSNIPEMQTWSHLKEGEIEHVLLPEPSTSILDSHEFIKDFHEGLGSKDKVILLLGIEEDFDQSSLLGSIYAYFSLFFPPENNLTIAYTTINIPAKWADFKITTPESIHKMINFWK